MMDPCHHPASSLSCPPGPWLWDSRNWNVAQSPPGKRLLTGDHGGLTMPYLCWQFAKGRARQIPACSSAPPPKQSPGSNCCPHGRRRVGRNTSLLQTPRRIQQKGKSAPSLSRLQWRVPDKGQITAISFPKSCTSSE